MTNHPLTNKMIDEIKRDVFSLTPEKLTPGLPSVWSSDCMRAAYDLAIEHINELWTEAQQMEEPHEIINHFENDLRLLFINKFLQSQKNN